MNTNTNNIVENERLVLKTNAELVNKLLAEGRITEQEAEQLIYVIEMPH